jgi:hypothetical protein
MEAAWDAGMMPARAPHAIRTTTATAALPRLTVGSESGMSGNF